MSNGQRSVSIPTDSPVWKHFFTVAPLVLVGTREDDGGHDLAPKHMAMPLGWQNYFCFVCSPRHATQRNIEARRDFTVSFPRAEPDRRDEHGRGAARGRRLEAEPRRGRDVPGLDGRRCARRRMPTCGSSASSTRIVDGFGENSLIVGRRRGRPRRRARAARLPTATTPTSSTRRRCSPTSPRAVRHGRRQLLASRSRSTSGSSGAASATAGSCARLRGREDEMGELLERLARAESPSLEPEAQRESAAILAGELEALGYRVARVAGGRSATTCYARAAARRDGAPRQLLVGHLDTVWPVGTARADAGRGRATAALTGPGVFDMKGGLVQMVFALRALRELGLEPAVDAGRPRQQRRGGRQPRLPAAASAGSRGARCARSCSSRRSGRREAEDRAQGRRALPRDRSRAARPRRRRARAGRQRRSSSSRIRSSGCSS